MSYRTFNIIIKIENDKEQIKEFLDFNFKFFNIREFFTPFNGYACQANENWKDHSFEKFPEQFFKHQDEVENHFDYKIEEKILKYSAQFPEKKIAFISIDCFGGKCTSEGYIIKNREKIEEQEHHHSAHQILLQKIDSNFKSWFFYPFTRTFFTDKGGINGDVINMSFMAIWMVVNQEFGNDKDYIFQATANEMMLECPNKFHIYFMKINEEWVKIIGSILVDDEAVFQKIKEIIEDVFLGFEYNIQLDNFQTGENLNLTSIDETKNEKLKTTSYRSTGFNTQHIDLSDVPSTEPEKKQTETKKKGFFERLFGK